MSWIDCTGDEKCRCEGCKELVLTVTIQGDEYHVADDWADLEDNGLDFAPLPQCQGCGHEDYKLRFRVGGDKHNRGHKVVCETCGETYYIHWTEKYNTVF